MEAPNPENDLILYVVPNCPHCDAAREQLSKLNLAYIEKDVTKSYSDLRQMYRFSRQKNVPVIVHSNKYLVRPSLQDIKDFLNLK